MLEMHLKKIDENIIVFIIILSVAILYFLTFRQNTLLYGDEIGYSSFAQSIAQGNLGAYINSHSFFYPWGFPLLLASVYFFFGMNIIAMKFLITIFFCFSLFVIFLIFKEKLSPIQTILFVLIFAVNPYFFLFKENIYSDIPFLFFSLLSVLLIQKFLVNDTIFINRAFGFFLIGMMIFFAYSTRVAGIILIPVLFFCQILINRQKITKEPLSYIKTKYYEFIPYLTFLICYYIIGFFLPPPSIMSYVNVSLDISNTGNYGISGYITTVITQFVAIFLNYGNYTSGSIYFINFILIALPFVLIGFIITYKKEYLYIIYTILSLGIVISFCHYEFRYFFTILPFFMYFFIIGSSKILSLNGMPINIKKYNSTIVNFILFLIVVISIIGLIYIYNNFSSEVMYSFTKSQYI